MDKSKTPEKRQSEFICIALLVATFAVFWSVHSNAFINYDDDAYISENPHVLNGLSWSGLKWAFTTAHTGYPHPLTWLTHQFDFQVFGLWAGGHHLTSVAIHATNSVLLFLLFWRMTRELWQSAFVAAVVALHPLHVESVAWAAERKDVLCGLFWLLTLRAYVSYAENPRWSRYAVVALLFFAGLLSKPTIVTLPFVLLLLDYWPLRRVQLDRSHIPQWFLLIREKIPLIALGGIFTAITVVTQHVYGGIRSAGDLPPLLRISNVLLSYCKYVANAVWPARLAGFYPFSPEISIWRTLGAALLLSFVTLVVLRTAKRRPEAAVGWLWFLGTLAPVIGLLQFGDQSMADRYMYIPIIGLSIMVAWSIPGLMRNWHYHRSVLTFAALVLVGSCALVTAKQATYWRDSITFYNRILAVNPGVKTPLVYDGLTDALMRAGRLEDADAMIAKTRRDFPDNGKRLNLAGLIKLKLNRQEEAEMLWKRALEMTPSAYQIYNNLGILYTETQRWNLARENFEHLVELRPDDAIALGNLAQLSLVTKNYGDAGRYCARAIAVAPRDPMLRALEKEISQRQRQSNER